MATVMQDAPATTSPAASRELTADVSKHVQTHAAGPQLLPGGLRGLYGRTTPDASPGNGTLTITGLPQGTSVISVWMTEWVAPNNSHAGAATFTTSSVQLDQNGTVCRVQYNLAWGTHLPAGFQVIYG